VNTGGRKQLVPIDLVRTESPALPMTVTFPLSEVQVAADAAFTEVAGAAPDERVYVWESDRVRVEKRFHFVADSYQAQLKVTVENKGERPLAHHLQLAMHGRQDPNIKPGGFFNRSQIQTEGVCDLAGKVAPRRPHRAPQEAD
jgi:hypothetical protein